MLGMILPSTSHTLSEGPNSVSGGRVTATGRR